MTGGAGSAFRLKGGEIHHGGHGRQGVNALQQSRRGHRTGPQPQVHAGLKDPRRGFVIHVATNNKLWANVKNLLNHELDRTRSIGRQNALARGVVEDLIDVLIEKNVIMLTDLPGPAQQKLMARRHLRGRLSNLVDLVEDGSGDI